MIFMELKFLEVYESKLGANIVDFPKPTIQGPRISQHLRTNK